MTKRTYVYIDGFNLYFGSIRDSGYHWLNVHQIARFAFPDSDIVRTKYFTARLQSRDHDPSQASRQDVYLRALKTVPQIKIIYGDFQSRVRFLPSCDPDGQILYRQEQSTGERKVDLSRVLKTEEKRSDVNLACSMLNDAFDQQYDRAIVISNDSDLVMAMTIVRDRFSKEVFVINPQRRSRPNKSIINAATLVDLRPVVLTMRDKWLKDAQFPDQIVDQDGRAITKPECW